MISPTGNDAAGRILVGVDGSAASQQALRWALGQSQRTGQRVHAVISWDYPTTVGPGMVMMGDLDWEGHAENILRTTVAETLDPAEAGRVTQHVVCGHPAQALLGAAGPADLLVVGSRGRGGFTGMLLGSVSQHVVAHAPCPVVVVPTPAPRAP